jgi:hypothetical protein
LTHRLVVAVIALGEPLAGPALGVEAYGFLESLSWDTAFPNYNASTTQMLCHGRPMQMPASGELLHTVTGLILCNQLRNLIRSESALHLPLPRGFRFHPPAQQLW